jgi:hypothetical protein
MRNALAFLLVFMPLAFAFVLHGTGCVSPVDSAGNIMGLSGGSLVDAQLAQQNPPGVPAPTGPVTCPDAGLPGGNCMAAGDCCGIAAPASEICFFDGMSSGMCATEPEAGTGSTWTELYADYFGGHGRAACAGNGGCHGSGSQPGGAITGYVCPPDGDAGKDSCYTTLTSYLQGNGGLPSFVTGVLRSVACPGCAMPLVPTQIYTFSQTDVDRISAWIDAGAPNN